VAVYLPLSKPKQKRFLAGAYSQFATTVLDTFGRIVLSWFHQMLITAGISMIYVAEARSNKDMTRTTLSMAKRVTKARESGARCRLPTPPDEIGPMRKL